MSLSYVVDGETELDSELFNPWVDHMNGLQNGALPIALAGIEGALEGYGPLVNAVSRVFDVREFVADVSELATDATAAIAATYAAIEANGSGTMLFGPADYLIHTACTLVVTVPLVIDLNGQTIRRNEAVNWVVRGDPVTKALNSSVSRGATTVTLTDADGVAAGDILVLYEPVVTETGHNTLRYATLCVQSVSTNTVTVTSDIKMPFSSSGASAWVFHSPPPVTIRNGTLHYDNTPSDQFVPSLLRLQGLKRPRIESVRVQSDQAWKSGGPDGMGIRATECVNAAFTAYHAEGVSYGINLERCLNTVIQPITAHNVRHPVAIGAWSVGVEINGVTSDRAYQTIESHPAFDVNYSNVNATRDETWPNLRCIGGSIRNAKVYCDATNADDGPYFHSVPVSDTAWYDNATLTMDAVEFITPNITTQRAIGARYGHLVLNNVIATMGDGSDLPQFDNTLKSLRMRGCRNPDGTPWDRKAARIKVRSGDGNNLPAYLSSSVYHIDPYKTVLDADGGVLRAHGRIIEASTTDPQAIALRIHTNVWPEESKTYPSRVMGVLRLRATVRHSNSGSFDILTSDFHFAHYVVATSSVAFPTTAAYADGATGQANESLAITISNPTQAGATELGTSYPDTYVQIDVGVSSGRSNPVYSLAYELELIRT